MYAITVYYIIQIPEGNETLTVQLTAVSGDGRLAAGLLAQASLIVLHNDDPVSFAQSVVIADEGDTALLTINRGGQANGERVRKRERATEIVDGGGGGGGGC